MEDKKRQIRRDILLASYEAKACHIGSALSCVDILVDLLYSIPETDVFLFGKASGVLAYYAILADQGKFPKEKLAEYIKNYPLPSTEVPGVIHPMGSVGHALSVACGLALGDRTRTVHVLLSDGDCMEGSTYEAVLFAYQHQLKNLHVIVDNNGLVALGPTEKILSLDHAFEFMNNSLYHFDNEKTIKGKGVSFMENNHHWHYRNLTETQLTEALSQI
jgi:transketolase